MPIRGLGRPHGTLGCPIRTKVRAERPRGKNKNAENERVKQDIGRSLCFVRSQTFNPDQSCIMLSQVGLRLGQVELKVVQGGPTWTNFSPTEDQREYPGRNMCQLRAERGPDMCPPDSPQTPPDSSLSTLVWKSECVIQRFPAEIRNDVRTLPLTSPAIGAIQADIQKVMLQGGR